MAKGRSRTDVTGLLAQWAEGAPEAEARLMAAVYLELRRIAAAYMRHERCAQTLQPTALVHEAYARLARQQRPTFEGRAHFYGIAARLMRQVLVDHARERAARKRAGVRVSLSASKVAHPSNGRGLDVIALHEALDDLARLDARQARIVELRYFGGLTEAEVAAALGLSPATIRREVASARYFLGSRLRSR